MNARVTPYVLLAAFAGLLAVLAFGLNEDRDKNELPSTYLDREAPEFDLPSLTNPAERVGTASYAGEAALINVWATWCDGCRLEHPFLMELAALGPVPIYGINYRDDRDAALRWLQLTGDPYVASGFDADGRVGIDWGVYGAPETFLVSPDGIVVHRHTGPLTPEVWLSDFVPLLVEMGGAE